MYVLFMGFISDNSVTVVNESAVEAPILIEEEPVIPEEWLKEAEEAKQAVLKRKALEAEVAELEAIKASTTERINVLKKELGTY